MQLAHGRSFRKNTQETKKERDHTRRIFAGHRRKVDRSGDGRLRLGHWRVCADSSGGEHYPGQPIDCSDKLHSDPLRQLGKSG